MSTPRILTAIRPSGVELLTYPLVWGLILVLLFWGDLLHKAFPSVQLTGSAQLPDYASRVVAELDTPIVHTAIIVVFWALVGLLAYTIIWALGNVAVEVRNEVVIQSAYTNRGRASVRLQAFAVMIAAIAVCFGYLLLFAYLLLPLWIELFGIFVYAPLTFVTVLAGAGSIVGAAASTYVLWLLIRLVLGRLH